MAPPRCNCAWRLVVPVLLLLAFVSDFLVHRAAAGSEDAVVYGDEELAVYAPDADHLAAAESNFQRWLRHVKRSSSPPHRHRQSGHQSAVKDDSRTWSTSRKSDPESTADRFPDRVFSSSTFVDSERPLTSTTVVPPALKSRKHLRRACEKRVIHVEKDGSGSFTSIQAAVDSVPSRNRCRVDIRIGAGVFREKVTIRSSQLHVTLKGDPHRHTIITYNDTASSRDRKGRRLSTMHSATVAINSNYFIAKNITFMNTAPAQRPGAVAQQAVALRISGDKAAFFNCRFYAHQDTLYDHRGRHYFKDCYVTGTVDFVFGNGRSLYERAELVALGDHNGIPGTITAQKRNETTPDTGFSFVNSRVTGAGMVYLGRAWGNDSRVVFANTFMDKIVVPAGWGDWGVPAREKTVFYAQFNCSGPGAEMSHRVRWSRNLTAAQAAPFLTPSFINGENWLEGYKHKGTHGKKTHH